MNERIADFHALKERLVLHGTLTARTGLRIGSGGGGELDAVDLPVLRDGDGFPFVPGSSLKGALRSTLEALVRGAELDRSTGIWACDPFLQTSEKTSERACGFRDPETKKDASGHCAICRLLGSHILASHVRFTDALIDLPTDRREAHLVPIETRDGVAIHRDLRVARDSAKYDFEVVSPGTAFKLEVFVDNPQDWLMGLLVVGFEQIAEGFTALGGFTSRGLGRMEIVWQGLTRVDARSLLQGKRPTPLPEAALADQLETWRAALASRAQGGE